MQHASLEHLEEFNATRERFERWRNRRSRGGHDRQLKTLEDWDHWTQFKDGTQGIVDRALRVVIKAYANGRCALRWGLPGVNYREAAEKLKAAGFGWVKEQTFKDALRGKPPAENTIPANAPGVRELVLTLVGLWPAFEWERLVLDPPPGYLQEALEEGGKPAQNDEIAQAGCPVSVWENIIVAPVAMRTHRAPCNLQLPPLPEAPPSPVPVRPWIRPLSFVKLLRPEEEGGTILSAEIIAAVLATATGATA